MKYTFFILIVVVAILFTKSMAMAQSTEFYAGSRRTGVDIMWFKYFSNHQHHNTRFLFFSRNRASIDYKKTAGAFGSTNAVSYNLKNGIGFVVVGSFLNTGLTPKAGIQYYKQKGAFLFFGWLVADVKAKSSIDLFGLIRYTPQIDKNLKGFLQAELFPVYGPDSGNMNITERIRLGVKYHSWAFGAMMDFNQTGKTNFTNTENLGGFLRYDF